MSEYDDYDLTSEIEEGKREDYIHKCAMRDMDQGIRPEYGDIENEPEETE